MKSLGILLATTLLAAVAPAQKQQIEAEASADAAFLVAYSALQEAPRPAPKPDGLPVNKPTSQVAPRVAAPIVLAANKTVDPFGECETCARAAVPFARGSHDDSGPSARAFADGPVRRVARRFRDERPVRRFLGRVAGRLFGRCRGCR